MQNIKTKKFLVTVLYVVGVLALLDIPAEIWLLRSPKNQLIQQLATSINLTLEYNVPTFIQSTILLSIGMLALTLARQSSTPESKSWYLLGGLFVLMSADETACVHERLVAPIRALTGASGFFYYAWVIPAIVLVGVVALPLAQHFKRLENPFGRRFSLASAVYLGGALVMEMLTSPLAEAGQHVTLRFLFLSTIEELLEFIGSLLFLNAMLDLSEQRQLRFRPGSSRWGLALGVSFTIVLLVAIILEYINIFYTYGRNHLVAELAVLFNPTLEKNFTTWLESVGLLVCAWLCWGAACRRGSAMWKPAGLLFLLAALDETAALHERWSLCLRETWPDLNAPWTLPALICVALLALLYLRRLRSTSGQLALFWGTSIYLLGALLLKFPEGVVKAETSELEYYKYLVFEESLEMLGITLMLVSLIQMHRELESPVEVGIDNR